MAQVARAGTSSGTSTTTTTMVEKVLAKEKEQLAKAKGMP